MTSRGSGCEDIKLLFFVGVDDDDEKARLYEDELPLKSIGLLCGELYRAMISIPKLNMSAAGVTFPSMTKSGEV